MFALVCIVTAAVNILFGLVIFATNVRSRLYRIWLAFSVCTALWLTGFGLMVSSQSGPHAYLWMKWLHYGLGAIFLPTVYFHFSLELIDGVKKYKKQLDAFYIISLAFFIANVWDKFASVRPKFGFAFYTHPEPLYCVYTVWFAAVILYALKVLYQAYLKTEGTRKVQISYQILATLVGFGGGATAFFYVFDINVYPFGVLVNCAYCIIMSYAIARYRLMDIRVATISSIIFVIVYAITLGIPIYFYKIGESLVALIVMGILATMGPFVYMFLQRRANLLILAEQRSYHQTLINASSGMSQIKDLRKLVRLIVRIIIRAMKITHCGVYTYDRSNSSFVLGASVRRGKTRIKDLPECLPEDFPVIQYLAAWGMPVVSDDIKLFKVVDNIPNMLLSGAFKELSAAMIVPSIVNKRLVGFLVLGSKCNQKTFSEDDIAVFRILGNHAALAIENAQFYDDVKSSQELLYRAEKMATIGTMADGLSHQINNRFHVLGFISSDLRDSIEMSMKNPEKYPFQRLITDIVDGLKKIEENIIQGGQVVKGLLSYSQHYHTEKEVVSLSKLINASIQMVALKIRIKDLEIITNLAPDADLVWGNFVQLQEVLFNIIDNAHYSMMEKKHQSENREYSPKLIFSSHQIHDEVLLHIEDNGIGIREEDMKKLFVPFFTTKNSSRKGNGLGLFVMQKIVQDDHGGTIKLHSVFQGGVKIDIRLPVPKTEN